MKESPRGPIIIFLILLRDISYNDGDDDAHNDADGGDSDGDEDEDVTMSEITREIMEIEPRNEKNHINLP